MKFTRTSAVAGAACAVVAISLTACGSDSNGTTPSGGGTTAVADGCSGGTLSGAGSSFQDPMEQAWIQGIAGTCSGARVTYQAVGSGAGIQQFGNGTIDFAGSDVTMKPEEQTPADDRCGSPAIHIPVTAGGVGVTYNLPGVTGLQLSADSIAAIFTGKARTWDDAAIEADNPGKSLPNTPVRVFTRSDEAGTTAVFTSYLDAAATGWGLGSGKSVAWPVGVGKPQSAGVSAAVEQTKGGVTYVEQAFADQKNLPLARVKNSSGSYVQLAPKAVSAALAGAKTAAKGPNDLSQTINYKPTDAAAYPISSVSYVIVCTKYPSNFKGTSLLKAYLTYAVTDGQPQAESLGFAPLPTALAAKAKASIAAIG